MSETFVELEDEIRNTVLVEKYRPKRLEDVILSDESLRGSFEKMIKDKMIPQNLLFCSRSPGTGKSTLARIISSSVSKTVLKLNASLDRGIDTIRHDVEKFCVTQSMYDEIKIIVFEEFDNVTKDAQKALRDLMEDHMDSVRFILTCNYINNVIEPIRSRTALYKFGDVDQKEILKRLFFILRTENINFDKKNVAAIVKDHKSDIRSMIQTIQQLILVDEKGEKHLQEFIPDKELFKLIIKHIHEKDLASCRKLIGERNMDGQEILKYIFRNMETISPKKWPEVCYEISEGLYRMNSGVDSEIALVSTLYSIMNAV
jgi:replication factor C small subunit